MNWKLIDSVVGALCSLVALLCAVIYVIDGDQKWANYAILNLLCATRASRREGK